MNVQFQSLPYRTKLRPSRAQKNKKKICTVPNAVREPAGLASGDFDPPLEDFPPCLFPDGGERLASYNIKELKVRLGIGERFARELSRRLPCARRKGGAKDIQERDVLAYEIKDAEELRQARERLLQYGAGDQEELLLLLTFEDAEITALVEMAWRANQTFEWFASEAIHFAILECNREQLDYGLCPAPPALVSSGSSHRSYLLRLSPASKAAFLGSELDRGEYGAFARWAFLELLS